MIVKELNVVIETPRGSAEKYDYDPDSQFFVLSKTLPAGMSFPYDFGFIPGTRGEDGDPLDAMIFSEFRGFPGCMMKCRLIGAIRAEQQERDGHKVRNDRYLVIPLVSKVYRDLHTIPEKLISELEHFFIAYNEMAGKRFRPTGFVDAVHAYEQIKFIEK